MFARKLALGVASASFTLLLAEAGLQLASLWVWRSHTSGAIPVSADGRRAILCVGDSFTYGIGATSPEQSYPSQLQRILDEEQSDAGAPWRVVARAWPGRNSQEVLHHLPDQLAELSPALVVVLVGANDQWKAWQAPAAPAADLEQEEWHLEWRTLRLFRIARANLAATLAHGTEDGARGPRASAATALPGAIADDDANRLAPPVTPDVVQACLEAVPRRQPAAGLERVPPSQPAPRDPPTTEAGRKTRKLLERMLHDINSGDPVKRQRATALLPQVVAHLEGIEAHETLVCVLRRLNHREEALARAVAATERFGRSPSLCREVSKLLVLQHRFEEAYVWGIAAVEDEPANPRNLDALTDVYRSLSDWSSALKCLALAYRLGLDPGWLEQRLAQLLGPARASSAEIQATLEELPLWPEGRATLLRMVEQAGDQDSWKRQVRENLAAIAAAVRRSGAGVLFLTYPHRSPASAALAQIAAERSVPLVDLRPVFQELLATVPKGELFVGDGHCTDRGYQVVAREAAAAIRSWSE